MDDIKEDKPELKPEHRIFCEAYIFDFNATRAYLVAYPESGYNAARSSASALLTNANIKAYISELEADMARTSGISRLKVLREHEKLAFSSIAHLHNTWITRKDFEVLTEDQKSCIAEIQTQTRTVKDFSTKEDGEDVTVDFVKVKLYDKQKALDSISKILGFDSAQKIDHTTKGEKMDITPPQIIVQNTGIPMANAEAEVDAKQPNV